MKSKQIFLWALLLIVIVILIVGVSLINKSNVAEQETYDKALEECAQDNFRPIAHTQELMDNSDKYRYIYYIKFLDNDGYTWEGYFSYNTSTKEVEGEGYKCLKE